MAKWAGPMVYACTSCKIHVFGTFKIDIFLHLLYVNWRTRITWNADWCRRSYHMCHIFLLIPWIISTSIVQICIISSNSMYPWTLITSISDFSNLIQDAQSISLYVSLVTYWLKLALLGWFDSQEKKPTITKGGVENTRSHLLQ